MIIHRLAQLGHALGRMFIPTPMVRVGLFFLADDAAAVVSVLARLGVCQVDRLPSELEDYLEPCFPDRFRSEYRRLRQRYEPLAQRWQLAGVGTLVSKFPQVPSVEDMQQLADRLESVAARADELAQRTRRLKHRRWELEHFDEYLRMLSKLDIDVDTLSDLRFLHVRPGTVPVENLGRLRRSAELSGDLVLSLGVRGERAHILVVGAAGISPDLEGLLAKAHFEPHTFAVPLLGGAEGRPPQGGTTSKGEATSGPPQTIQAQLEVEAAAVHSELQRLSREDDELKRTNWQLMLQAGGVLACASVFVECESVLEGHSGVAFLNGWVAVEQVDALRQALAHDVANPVALVQQPPAAEVENAPPSKTAVPRVFQAGADLVSMYGRPGYDELDPTLIIAVTTPLLFGMMFGDVGHGLILLVATLALRRWLGPWVALGVSCSAGAILFGFLYGSVFGMEHWLPALWVRPMEDPFRLIAAALWMGVGFVLLTFLLKAGSLLRQNDWLTALLGFQGLAGAVFYVGAVLEVRWLYLEGAVAMVPGVLMLAGLILIVLHASYEIRRRGRTVLADLISEHFHALLSLLTNTLSFLRLAAFALAHSALSLATFLIMETIPPTAAGWVGRATVFLLGTVVILVLDGLAVGIQTLRLQFYEGLARYYRGDGRVYRPLRFGDAR